MKILGVKGSMGEDSIGGKILRHALSHVVELGNEIEFIDLKDLHLPFCEGKRFYPDYPDVERLRHSFFSSQGIVLLTPEYHGSLTGSLKNALDLLTVEHVGGKVIALISICGGIHSSNALNALRLICRHLHALVIPEQLTIAHANKALTLDGRFKDKAEELRLIKMMEHLCHLSHRLG